MNKTKATIFYKSEFFGNIVKLECWLVDHGTRKYAQYDAAPFVRLIKKRARTVLQIQQSYSPYIAIVEGWDLDLKTEELYSKTLSSDNGVTVKTSKYSSFDSRYVSDFEETLKASNVNVIAIYK